MKKFWKIYYVAIFIGTAVMIANGLARIDKLEKSLNTDEVANYKVQAGLRDIELWQPPMVTPIPDPGKHIPLITPMPTPLPRATPSIGGSCYKFADGQSYCN